TQVAPRVAQALKFFRDIRPGARPDATPNQAHAQTASNSTGLASGAERREARMPGNRRRQALMLQNTPAPNGSKCTPGDSYAAQPGATHPALSPAQEETVEVLLGMKSRRGGDRPSDADGAWKRRFLADFRNSGNVRAACDAAGIS